MPAPDAAKSNPFSTRFIRPGAIEYLFAPGQTADSLIDRLRHNQWRGQIIGPHGSGKSTLAVRAAGFAYERLRGAAEYFNLIYYRPIRWAYEHGVRQIHLGIGSLHTKTLRGGRLAPLWVVPVGWSWADVTAIRRANAERAADPVKW